MLITRILIAMTLCLSVAGCMNVTTRLQPEDKSVPETLEGSDCVPMIFGIFIGTATVDQAMANTRSSEGSSYGYGPTITKLRRVEWTDYGFLYFGARCVEVTGDREKPQ